MRPTDRQTYIIDRHRDREERETENHTESKSSVI